MTSKGTAKAQEPGLASQNELVDKLKGGLDQMKGKLHELTAKRNENLWAGKPSTTSTTSPQKALAPHRSVALGVTAHRMRRLEGWRAGGVRLAEADNLGRGLSEGDHEEDEDAVDEDGG